MPKQGHAQICHIPTLIRSPYAHFLDKKDWGKCLTIIHILWHCVGVAMKTTMDITAMVPYY